MRRLNFTLDDKTVSLLEKLADSSFSGNKSQTVRAALEHLADEVAPKGWIIAGYTPKELEHERNCHSCGASHGEGTVLYQPVFERGNSSSAFSKMPSENWLDCPGCAEKKFSS